MKKFILFFALFAMCLGVKAQPILHRHDNFIQLLDYCSTDSILYSVDSYHCTSGNDIYCFFVGKNGTIYKSQYFGGESPLSLIESSTTKDLYKVKFVNDSIGYIAGEKGTILKTIDGGISWFSIGVDMSYSLYDITTLGSDTCWISGGRNHNWYLEPGDSVGVLLRTVNGGQSWDIDSSYNEAVNKILLVNDSLAYMVRTSTDTSLIYISTNLGDTFSQITSISEIEDGLGVHKITDVNYYNGKIRVCTYPFAYVYYSDDSGESWHNCSSYGHKLLPINECNSWSILYPTNSTVNLSNGMVYIYSCDEQEYNPYNPFWSDLYEGGWIVSGIMGYYTDFCKVQYLDHSISAIMSYFNEEQHVIASVIVYDTMITTANECEANQTSVYPNPSSSFFTILLPDEDTYGLEYSIYDVMGRLLERNAIEDSYVTIDNSNWQSGIYEIIVSRSGEMIHSEKIIKE